MKNSRLFPELNLLETKVERKKVYLRALKRLRRSPQLWIYYAIAIVVLGATMFLALRVRGRFPWGLAGLIVGFSFAASIQFVFRRPLRKQIRLQLVAMGIPICIACGYDLRGQRQPRCPECGRPFDAKLISG